MSIQIEYTPEIVKRGTTRHDRVEDGDTVFVTEGIRMLGIDTPEIHFPGNSKPSNSDGILNKLSGRLKAAGANDGLADYLKNRLKKDAGTRQLKQGKDATDALEADVKKRLAKFSEKTGKPIRDRDVYIQIAEDVFDHYGRILAYVAPSYSKAERKKIAASKRPTFNLQMLKLGWASTIIIYPNVPKLADLELVQKAVKDARKKKKGAWKDPNILLGYEFRACVRLAKGDDNWITRYCVDMTNRHIHRPQDYYRVDPENRIFVQPRDLLDAMQELDLIPDFW